MTAERPVVLVVGAASRDLVADDPRGWRLGGAVLFCSLALARLGLEVRAVAGVDAKASRGAELDLLRDAGVATAFARLDSGPVFDNVRHILHATSDTIPLTALPRRWTSGFDALLAVPVAAEVDDEWATLVGRGPAPLVALGWQGLLRRLVAGTVIRARPPTRSPLVGAARLAVVSREDAAPGVTSDGLAALLAPDSTLAWTEGVEGGVLLGRDPEGRRVPPRRYPAIPSERLVDPTGAGDVFLAAMLAATLAPSIAAPYEPATFAAAASSLTVEGPGLLGVPDLAAVLRRAARAPSLASRRPSATSRCGSGRPSQA